MGFNKYYSKKTNSNNCRNFFIHTFPQTLMLKESSNFFLFLIYYKKYKEKVFRLISPIKATFNNNSLNSSKSNECNPSFKGPLEVLTKGLELCDKYPMVGVSVIDGTTAIIPRTLVDARTNGFMAAETFRRESMGLFINCLFPSFAVLGLAKAVQPFTMGKEFRHLDMASVWANEEVLNKFSDFYKNTSGTTEQRIRQYTQNLVNNIEGFEGSANTQWKNFSGKTGDAAEKLADLILKPDISKKETKKALGEIFSTIANNTKATEIIRFQGDNKAFSSNLSEVLRDAVDLGRRFKDKAVTDNLAEFVKRGTKLINRKSIVGMAFLIPLAMSVQFINRAITKWHSGHDGAPIYKDFGKQQPIQIHKDKKNLGLNKAIASAVMVGTTLLTNKNGFSKKLFQFKGMFPTLDQCRWIATATIVSRMLASDDNSELKETAIRDIATFLGLYALGDFVAKGTGSIIEKVKPGIKLLSRETLDKAPTSILGKTKYWFNNTKLKSFAEVSQAAKPYRSLCQLAHLGSSMLVLGLAIPRYVRSCTERKEKRMLEIAKAQQEFAEKIKAAQKNNAFASFKASFKAYYSK